MQLAGAGHARALSPAADRQGAAGRVAMQPVNWRARIM
tara:strand:+ start:266 stop:379 length:114 start_codon:yes stop_codon:yes gene_type:complete